MKNKVISIIMLFSVLILVIVTTHGIEKFSILSIKRLKEKNNQLKEKINEATNVTSKDYPDNIEILEETYERYKVTKEKYEELSGFVDDENMDIYESKQYDIGYLWKIFGKYAASRNLKIGIDVRKNYSKKDSYNLNFTVAGQYVNISQFITDIENNSDLYFRIYNFSMSGSGETVTATFVVKDISIDPSTLSNIGTSIDSIS